MELDEQARVSEVESQGVLGNLLAVLEDGGLIPIASVVTLARLEAACDAAGEGHPCVSLLVDLVSPGSLENREAGDLNVRCPCRVAQCRHCCIRTRILRSCLA